MVLPNYEQLLAGGGVVSAGCVRESSVPDVQTIYDGQAEGPRSLDNSSAHLDLGPPPLPVPCPTACRPSRNSHPQSRRCWTIDLAIVRRSSSVSDRRSPRTGARGSANPMSKARWSSTLHPSSRSRSSAIAGSCIRSRFVLYERSDQVKLDRRQFRERRCGRPRVAEPSRLEFAKTPTKRTGGQ